MMRELIRIARQEIRLLMLFLVAAASLMVFGHIAEEVQEGETHGFDLMVLESLRTSDPGDPIGPVWFEDMARDVTSLGSTALLVLVIVAVSFYLFLARKRGSALFLIAAVVSGTLASTLLKDLFARSRPDAIYQATEVYTASFPSGHAFLSAVTYLTLGTLLMRAQPRRRMKAYIFSLALIIVILVGLTRIYLGVHWTTDVLAGWALGAGWAAASWFIMLVLQRRHTIETPEEENP